MVIGQVQKPPKKGKAAKNQDFGGMKADGGRLILKKGHQLHRPMGNINIPIRQKLDEKSQTQAFAVKTANHMMLGKQQSQEALKDGSFVANATMTGKRGENGK